MLQPQLLLLLFSRDKTLFFYLDSFNQVVYNFLDDFVLQAEVLPSDPEMNVLLLEVGGPQGDLVLFQASRLAGPSGGHIVLCSAFPIPKVLVLVPCKHLFPFSDDWLWSQLLGGEASRLRVEVRSWNHGERELVGSHLEIYIRA